MFNDDQADVDDVVEKKSEKDWRKMFVSGRISRKDGDEDELKLGKTNSEPRMKNLKICLIVKIVRKSLKNV